MPMQVILLNSVVAKAGKVLLVGLGSEFLSLLLTLELKEKSSFYIY